VTHAELISLADKPWNDIVVDARGNAYVNSIGFEFPGEDPAPGLVAVVAPDGAVRQVADDLAFPNGMAITDDGSTLLVAESYGEQVTAYDIEPTGDLTNRRVWAATPGHHPDGICLDADGALWYADVATGTCTRVREGGEVLGTVTLDRGAFACALSRDDGEPRLYVIGQQWGGDPAAGPTGQVVVFPAPARAPLTAG
jgi:sugar lactone lactonase YvrE